MRTPARRPEPPAAREPARAARRDPAAARPLPGGRLLQAKLRLGAVDDPLEREADRVAEAVVSSPAAPRVPVAVQRKCAACAAEEETAVRRSPAALPVRDEEEKLQAKRPAASSPSSPAAPEVGPRTAARIGSLRGGGEPMSPASRAYFEPRFGRDLSAVRLHTRATAAAAAGEVGARAFTVGSDVAFGAGEYRPETGEGRRLLAHELAHTVQQGASRDRIQCDHAPGASPQPAAAPDLSGPLTDDEWQQLELWQSRGEVGIDPLTEDPQHNALVVAEAIFCSRSVLGDGALDDPLLCVLPEVTRADPRVQQLAVHANARGPIINWTEVDEDQRILHVMELLIEQYGFPVPGAAGLVGNLMSESHVVPNKIERAGAVIPGATPLTERDFAGQVTDFTAEQVMNRNHATRQGPRRPGVGLAQWTSANRRTGLFQHAFQGRVQGAAILFNMDAQVDYLVTELATVFPGVNVVLTAPGVSLDDASDEVVYRFEVPGAVLDGAGQLLPRTDPAVQGVFQRRRANSRRALQVFRAAHP